MFLHKKNLSIFFVLCTATTCLGMDQATFDQNASWNYVLKDVQNQIVYKLDDVAATSISLTNKVNWELVQEQVPMRKEAAHRQRKLLLLHALKQKPMYAHLNFTDAIRTVEHAYDSEYIPKYLPITQNDIHNITWNKDSSACAFAAKMTNGNPICIYAVVDTASDEKSFRTISRYIGTRNNDCNFYHPYFVSTYEGAVLLFQHPVQRAVEMTLSTESCKSSRTFLRIELDLEDGTNPHSIYALQAFPHVAQQCALTASRLVSNRKTKKLICSLSDIQIQGFPITDSDKEKIKTVITQNGQMPAMNTISTKDMISWALFNYRCNNFKGCITYCDAYKRITMNPNIPPVGTYNADAFLNNRTLGKALIQKDQEASHGALQKFLDTQYKV
jgi:hypothetical protein